MKNSIVGKRFGYWKVLRFSHETNGQPKRKFYLCRCVCKKTKTINIESILRGLSKSCGCKRGSLVAKSRTKHGMCGTKVYYAWRSIKSRCYNKKHKFYNYYGGAGIKVFHEWMNSFEKFYKYIGNPPSPAYSIERIDSKKDYAPNNVRWATSLEQANNKRNNRMITHNGQTFTLAEWSRKTGIRYDVLKNILKKSNYRKTDILSKYLSASNSITK